MVVENTHIKRREGERAGVLHCLRVLFKRSGDVQVARIDCKLGRRKARQLRNLVLSRCTKCVRDKKEHSDFRRVKKKKHQIEEN